MKIIPAIDLIEGKCVRLTQGDYSQKKIYNENPLDVALSFQDAGLKNLHLVDLDGAKAGKVVNWKVVESLTSNTNLSIDFGGGIKTRAAISELLGAGIQQVNLGSIAVKNAELVFDWIKEFGADKIILSADVKDELVQISGWQENAALTISDFVQRFLENGITTVTCTDIATDGMLSGPNVALYKKLMKKFSGINWIASGGVSSLEDVVQLKGAGLSGVIIGKAIYEGRITLNELSNL